MGKGERSLRRGGVSRLTFPNIPNTATQRMNKMAFHPAMKIPPKRRTKGTKYATQDTADRTPTTTA